MYILRGAVSIINTHVCKAATTLGIQSLSTSCPGSRNTIDLQTLGLSLWAFHFTDSPTLVRRYACQCHDTYKSVRLVLVWAFLIPSIIFRQFKSQFLSIYML